MRKRRILSILTALALCLSLLPATALAAGGVSVSYLDANGDSKTCNNPTEVESSTSTWTGTPDSGWYVVSSDVTFTDRITVTGDVHLILTDGKTLTASKGISVTSGNSLTIYGQSTGGNVGKLNAGGASSTPESCAGIGGNSGESAANSAITINGGVINAYGGENGAGIGGGANETAGARSITINGGTVIAEGGARAAGIGSGYGEDAKTCGPIKIIKRAKVTAKGGHGAAGIGGSYGGRPTGQITISGNANVVAEGGSGSTADSVRYGAAGIGSGGNGKAGNILISGGTVDARGAGGGGNYGAGIGSGANGTAGNITISSGTVTASSLLNKGAGIGNGTHGTSGTFSTTSPNGTPGKAVIYTNSISDTSMSDDWSGIVFVGENRNIYEGIVYGNIVLNKDFTLESKDTLIVPASSSLTVTGKTFTIETDAKLIVEEGGTLVNNGELVNNGTTTIAGTLSGSGTTSGEPIIYVVTGVTLDPTTLSLLVGQEGTLNATVLPEQATQTVTWTSSDTAVATVDSNGKVTAVAVGEATITAKAGEKEATCTVTVTEPEPEPEKYTVTVSASPAEGGTVSGDGTYTERTEVTVTATAEEGYHFVKWVEGDREVSTAPSYTFAITADRTLTAVFEANAIPHTHTYDADAWAFNAAEHWQQCSDPNCPNLEESKQNAAAHSYDDEMDTICNVCGYVRMVTPPEPETYTVTILNGGFGAEGAGSYREGDRVYLYAGRRANYEFAGWWSADVTLEDADSVYTSFIMPDYPVVVEALWYKEDHSPSITLPTHDITVDGGSHGDVEVWPEEAKMTTTVTITALPDEGYEVDEVIVTDENGKELTVTEKGDDKYTFSMPNGDVTIEVTFRPVSGSSSADPGLTITAPAGWVNPYTDVAVTAWYYNAVGYASANGLMGGTSATTFAPESTMNRSMVWTVIARLAGQTITGSTWAEDAKAWAVAQGVSDGTNPDGSVTREELVTMLYRYAGSPEMNVPELGLINGYPDSADISDWAQNAFAWALSTGVIDGRDGKLAAGDNVTRAEAATILARFHMLSK